MLTPATSQRRSAEFPERSSLLRPKRLAWRSWFARHSRPLLPDQLKLSRKGRAFRRPPRVMSSQEKTPLFAGSGVNSPIGTSSNRRIRAASGSLACQSLLNNPAAVSGVTLRRYRCPRLPRGLRTAAARADRWITSLDRSGTHHAGGRGKTTKGHSRTGSSPSNWSAQPRRGLTEHCLDSLAELHANGNRASTMPRGKSQFPSQWGRAPATYFDVGSTSPRG